MTWDDFEAMAKKLTSGQGADKNTAVLFIAGRLALKTGAYRMGSIPYSTRIQITISLSPITKWLLRMQKNGTIMKYSEIKSGNIHYSSPFMKGQVAMLPMGTWFMSTLIAKTKSGENKANWAVATLPHPKGVKAGYTVGSATPLVINQASSKKMLHGNLQNL